MLAHVAQAQGVIAAEAMAGVQTFPINYDMVPRATYSQPQVASFGYTEAQAKKQGHQVVVSKFPLTASGRAWGLGRTSGFIKLIIDAAHNEILGAHLVGAEVVEMLGELTLAQMWDLTASELGRNIHLHPSLSEAIGEASLGVGGGALNL
jgi:dihydrolipoamide dehydrogenase